MANWLDKALNSPWEVNERLIADERNLIENTLIELVDREQCDLVLTTGGTGPALRDVTPEATLAVADKEMPGFGEEMRRIGQPMPIRQKSVAAKEGSKGTCSFASLPGPISGGGAFEIPSLPLNTAIGAQTRRT